MSSTLENPKPTGEPSSTSEKPGILDSIRYDLPAGLVAFLVAVPLCLGIALASGAPLMAGLAAGMLGGLVVPLVSGAQLSVSGPAAGLAAVVVSGIAKLGSFQTFVMAVLIAGVVQVLMGVLRLGRFSRWFPSAVVTGMLAAIGVLLIMKQIPHAIGFDKDAFSDEDGVHWSMAFLKSIEPTAVVVAVLALVALVGWEKLAKKKGGLLTFIPAPLVAVGVAVATHEVAKLINAGYGLESKHMVLIPPPSELTSSLAWPDLSLLKNGDIWVVGVTIAIVASIETLLNVEAMDKLDPYRRRSPMNRELIAQGLANTAAGLIGALPVTSVVVRSSAAMQAGGRTRAAAFFHGILMVLAFLVLAPALERIPIAALAAILLATGYKLASPKVMKTAWKEGWEHFVPFAATLVGVVALDLLKGVGAGLVVAIILAVRRGLGKAVEVKAADEEVVVKLVKHVPFFARARVQDALDAAPSHARVVVDAAEARSVHRDVTETILEFQKRGASRTGGIEIRGLAGVA